MSNFKKRFDQESRQKASANVMHKYPNKVPVIVEKNRSVKSADLPEIAKQKYLVPIDATVGRFIHEIRKQIKLKSEQALFIFVDKDILPSASAEMGLIYQKYRDIDGFLYLTYTGENTFG